MRLNPAEINAIKTAAKEVFGPATVVRLFGSRVNDQKRGGDIDLHVEVDQGKTGLRYECRFLDLLFQSIDEQKVDLVVTERGRPLTVFEQVAYRDGVVL